MTTTDPASLRTDARLNRQRLITAAAAAFASGKPVSLDAIAKRAGVGSGTLYRHFPRREDLVEEVYRDQIGPLRETADALLADGMPVAHALREWMISFAEWAGDRRGICEALVAMSAAGRFGTGPVCDEVQGILGTLLEAGAETGELRPDIHPADVGGMLAGVISVAGAEGQEQQFDRMIGILIDGLRATG